MTWGGPFHLERAVPSRADMATVEAQGAEPLQDGE